MEHPFETTKMVVSEGFLFALTYLGRMGDDGLVEVLEQRLKTLLPAMYEDCERTVEPVSMGSAGLQFENNGAVAWDKIWGSYCDLAMAGGPPHRGTLLEPGLASEIAAEAGRYGQVAAEISRGIGLVTRLEAEASRHEGWVRVECPERGLAHWMTLAVTMENVSARRAGRALLVPVGPGYRLEKEVKNVIVGVVKTYHYWSEHMPGEQKQGVADLLEAMESQGKLVQPGLGAGGGWVGVECGQVKAAIWMMRMVAGCNLLARREGTMLFVASGERAEEVLSRLRGVAAAPGCAGF